MKLFLCIIGIIVLLLIFGYGGLIICTYSKNKNITQELSKHDKIVLTKNNKTYNIDYKFYYIDNELHDEFKVWLYDDDIHTLKFSEYNKKWKFND